MRHCVEVVKSIVLLSENLDLNMCFHCVQHGAGFNKKGVGLCACSGRLPAAATVCLNMCLTTLNDPSHFSLGLHLGGFRKFYRNYIIYCFN